jgi:hypothetical protein
MTDISAMLADYEPDLGTIELVCERLGEIGHQIGPDTARSLVRAIVQREALRVDARMREAIEISLQTIKVAAQSAIGVLAATTPVEQPPATEKASPPAPAVTSSGRRPIVKRKPSPEPPEGPIDGERRPVFRRPRGR